MKRLVCYLFILTAFSCSPQNNSNSEDLSISATLEHPFIHSAYFWFKEGTSQEQIEAFKTDSEKLANVETVKAFYSGQPANTDRPVIENTYDYAIVFHFANLADQEVYQKHPLHLEMIDKHEGIWEKVMVTDIEH